MSGGDAATNWLLGRVGDDLEADDKESLQSVLSDCADNAEDDLVVILQAFSNNFSMLPANEQRALVRETLEKANGPVSSENVQSEGPASSEQLSANAGLKSLLDMYPNLSLEFLQHVIDRQLGDVQEAAVWLVNEDNVEKSAAEWEERMKQAAKQRTDEANAEKKARKALINRFAFEPDAKLPSAKQQTKLGAWGTSNQSGGSKIRFRDGVPVAGKGEKFITVSPKEEWNGGSSGKVFTKGKRGKGVV